jgi:biopolymer transport protein ExbB
MAEGQNTVTGRMIAKGISRLGMPLADIRTSIENVGNLEVQRLEKRLTMLATISGAAPMVGFLGTVQGLIASFITIASLEGNVNPSVMADGIYTAMVTTAGGLIVGIPAYVGYNVLTSMLNSVIFKLELTSTEFVDLLQEPAR